MSCCSRKELIPRLTLLLLVTLSASAFAGAVTIKGYLMDVSCSARKMRKDGAAAAHTKACLRVPYCDQSGFGILTEDKQFIKFDEGGNAKVRKFLADIAKENDIRVTVSGSIDHDQIKVDKIELQ